MIVFFTVLCSLFCLSVIWLLRVWEQEADRKYRGILMAWARLVDSRLTQLEAATLHLETAALLAHGAEIHAHNVELLGRKP